MDINYVNGDIVSSTHPVVHTTGLKGGKRSRVSRDIHEGFGSPVQPKDVDVGNYFKVHDRELYYCITRQREENAHHKGFLKDSYLQAAHALARRNIHKVCMAPAYGCQRDISQEEYECILMETFGKYKIDVDIVLGY